MAQLAEAPASKAGGSRFESGWGYVKIEVIYSVAGAVQNDEFTCARASAQILNGSNVLNGGSAVIIMVDGEDSKGPVLSVQYADVHRIAKRPS